MLGDGGGDQRRLDALHRRPVRRGNDGDGARAPRGRQRALDEFAHLAAALADEADDDDVRLGTGDNLRDQRRLADAGAAENADPLPLPAGQQPVDDPQADG